MIGCGLGRKKPCDLILWDDEKSAPEEEFTWEITGADATWQIKLNSDNVDGEFCMQAGRKNGSPVVAEKCEDIPGGQEAYPFSKQQWRIEPVPPRLP